MGKMQYKVKGTTFEVDDRYEVKKKIGQGAYGLICAATDRQNGDTVAVKKIANAFEDAIDCKRTLREIRLLQHFNHENVLNLRDIMLPPPGPLDAPTNHIAPAAAPSSAPKHTVPMPPSAPTEPLPPAPSAKPDAAAAPPATTPSIAWLNATEQERESVDALVQLLQREEPSLLADALFEAFGGRDRAMLCYLRAGDVNFDLALARARLKGTAAFRAEMGLTPSLDVAGAIAAHPLRPHWPGAFPMSTPLGSPVLFCRAGLIRPKLLTRDGEQPIAYLLTLWMERALELQAATQAKRPCKGTVDVYDCSSLSFGVLSEWGALRTLKASVGLAQAHYPENLYRCFVINAPRLISMVWSAVKPLLNERTRHKINISSGVPDALAEELGGAAALQAVLDSVPDPSKSMKKVQ